MRYKYFEELENPSNYDLPTLKMEKSNFQKSIFLPLPISYYEKYESLFEKLKTLCFQLSHMDFNKKYLEFLKLEDDYYDLKSFFERRDGDSEFEIVQVLNRKINLTRQDISYCLRWYDIVLNILLKINPNNPFYHEISNELLKAQQDLSSISSFQIQEKERKVVLPNAWYITALGDLYNTGDGHKETNLIYPFENVKNLFLNNKYEKLYESRYLWLKRKYFSMKKNQCVSLFDCQEFLNYRGSFFTFGDYSYKRIFSLNIEKRKDDFSCNYDKIWLNEKEYLAVPKAREDYMDVAIDTRICYERHLYKVILGVISAELSLYQFFWNVYQHSENALYEFQKLMELKRDDIFIKCLGLSKIETCLSRMITTSSFRFLEEFERYLKNGWNINFEYPLLMNQEKKEVVSGNSIITEHYVEEEILIYMRKKREGDGDILLSGRKL